MASTHSSADAPVISTSIGSPEKEGSGLSLTP